MTQSNEPGGTRRLNSAADFHRTRWLYQQDDRDVGPFSPVEIQDLIRQNVITIRTKIRRAARQQWIELGEIDHFAAYIHELAKERRRMERERELDQAENAVRNVQNRPKMFGVILAGVLILGSGVYGWMLWEKNTRGRATGYDNSLVRNLNLPEISSHKYLNTSGEIQWPSEKVPERKIRKRRMGSSKGVKRSKPAAAPIKRQGSADDLEPNSKPGQITDLSFGSGGGVGRELSIADVHQVRTETVPKLIRCAQAQADKSAGFPGTTVRYTIKSNGRLGNLRVGKNGKRSRSFVSCVKRVIGSSRVAPFDGAGRTITVPLKVGN
mgnify:CR=1 FL=1